MALPLISTFKSQLANGGGAARPNLFKVSIKNSPNTALNVTQEEEILVKPIPIKKKTIPKKKKKSVVKQVKKVRNVLIKEKPLITQYPPLTEKKLHNPFKNLYSIS